MTLESRTELGRQVLGPDFSFVSRLQAVAQALEAPGVVTIESLGTNPTGVRATGTKAWRWLAKGESTTLGLGDQVALSEVPSMRYVTHTGTYACSLRTGRKTTADSIFTLN